MHPLIVRHVLLPVHERVLRRPTLAMLRAMERSQWWPADRLRASQEEKLQLLLQHAHDRVPFYRRRLDEAGIDPAHVRLDDLARLPTLDKATIRQHFDALCDPSVPGGLHPMSTGGSTGAPLRFMVDRRRQAADQAARLRSRRWFGIEPGERELYVWGSPVEWAATDRLKRLRDRATNHRLLNAFNMSPATMTAYLHELARFNPVHLFGYPSSLAQLARHAAATGSAMRGAALRAVFTSGEVLVPDDRAVIESATGVVVADGYGSREGGFVAQQCPAGRYHVTMESVIVEVIDADGRAADHGAGEIVLTHLDAYGMPFIRYRTGDVGRCSSAACPCGRGLAVLDGIEGRRTDLLRRADGATAHALSAMYVLREEPAIEAFKIVQRPSLDLDVQLVCGAGFDGRAAERVRRGLRSQLGAAIDVRLHRVAAIAPEASGKYRCVVSEADRHRNA